jgi:hypothetical protein
MKKFYLLLLGIALSAGAQAQIKVGLKFSPTLATNRVEVDSDTLSIDSDGVGLKFVFGPTIDYFFGDNYAFSTGLLYAPKRIGLDINTTAEANQSFSDKQSYNLQYLQIPATVKLFTNELALDTRMYFQMGGLFEIKINEKGTDEDNAYLENVRPFDFGLHLGAGVERRMGYNTVLFGGFFYNRGLINAAGEPVNDIDLKINNDLLGLDLGVKF